MRIECLYKTFRFIDFSGYDDIEEDDSNLPIDYEIYRYLQDEAVPNIYFYSPRYDEWWFYYLCELNNKWYARQDTPVEMKTVDKLFYELDNEPHFIHGSLIIVDNGKTYMFSNNELKPDEVLDYEAILTYTFACKPKGIPYIICPRDFDDEVNTLYLRDKETFEPLRVDRIVKQNRKSSYNQYDNSYHYAYTIFESHGILYKCENETGYCHKYNGNVNNEW